MDSARRTGALAPWPCLHCLDIFDCGSAALSPFVVKTFCASRAKISGQYYESTQHEKILGITRAVERHGPASITHRLSVGPRAGPPFAALPRRRGSLRIDGRDRSR